MLRRRRALALIPTLVLAIAAPAWAAVSADDVRRASEAVTEALRDAEALDAESRSALSREAGLRQTLEELVTSSEELRARRYAVRAAAHDRADELYMSAGARPGAGLILAGDFAQLAVRLAYAEAVLGSDRELVAGLAAAEADAQRLQVVLERAAADQRDLTEILSTRAAAAVALLDEAQSNERKVTAEWEWQEAERRRREAEAATSTTVIVTTTLAATSTTGDSPGTSRPGTTTTAGATTVATTPSTTVAVTSTTSAPAPPPVTGGPFPAPVERWRSLVKQYFSGGLVDEALSVMECESYGNPNAENSRSGASGLFQHLRKYWPERAKAAGFPDASPFNGEANIAAAAWLAGRSIDLDLGAWYFWSCKP